MKKHMGSHNAAAVHLPNEITYELIRAPHFVEDAVAGGEGARGVVGEGPMAVARSRPANSGVVHVAKTTTQIARHATVVVAQSRHDANIFFDLSKAMLVSIASSCTFHFTRVVVFHLFTLCDMRPFFFPFHHRE